MNNSLFKYASLFSLFVLVLYCFGFFFPSSLNWGFHFLGFLPPFIFISSLVVSLFAFLLIWKNYPDKSIEFFSNVMERKPFLFLTVVIGLFALVAVFLRVKIPLLGDSFVLLNNFEFTFSGDHPLYLHRSPLSFSYFYLIASLLNTTSYPALMDAFLVGELILGTGFIINTFFIVKHLFDERKARLVVFCYLMTLPYMQLFFGYAELYSVVLFSLSLFVLTSLLSLKKKAPFYFVPPVFLLLLSSNYLNIIILPALLFVTVLEYRNGKKWTIPVGYLLCGLIIVAVFASVGFDVQQFFQAAEHSHWLSVTKDDGDQFQAYGLFSPFHFFDLLNLGMLLGSSAMFISVAVFLKEKQVFIKNEIHLFFISSFILVLGFIAVVKFDLGFPKDWDVPAPYFFLLNLFALHLFFQTNYSDKIKIVTLLTVVSMLTSLPWFMVNVNPGATLKRSETLLDARNTSPSGIYQSMFHISMYYHHHKLLDQQIDVWKRYTKMVPNDWRGLQNLAKSYYESGESNDSLTVTAFERWVQVDSMDDRGKIEYANFLSERGLMNYKFKKFAVAESQFQKAIALNPELVAAYNNLAILYLENQQPDSAILLCRRAVVVNPSYALAFQNMANAFAQKMMFDSAIVYYQKVISIDPAYLNAYENLSRAYYQNGDEVQAMNLLRQAARLGSATAQYLLKTSGETW